MIKYSRGEEVNLTYRPGVKKASDHFGPLTLERVVVPHPTGRRRLNAQNDRWTIKPILFGVNPRSSRLPRRKASAMSAAACIKSSTAKTNGTASAAAIGALNNRTPMSRLIAPRMKDPMPPPENPPLLFANLPARHRSVRLATVITKLIPI